MLTSSPLFSTYNGGPAKLLLHYCNEQGKNMSDFVGLAVTGGGTIYVSYNSAFAIMVWFIEGETYITCIQTHVNTHICA